MTKTVHDTAAAKKQQEAAKAILEPFLKRAYRRPVSPEEVGRFLRFIDLAEKKGDNFEKGIQLAMKAALCSPNFLFRIEKDFRIKGETFAEPVTQFELA